MITVSFESKSIEFSDNFKDLSDIAVPLSPQSLMGCCFVRLNKIQKHVLKCASVIGHEFGFGLLLPAYPAENQKDMVSKEVLPSLTTTGSSSIS